MEEERICAECGEPLGEDEEGYELDDGSVICESCFDRSYEECGSCGRVCKGEEMNYWGDIRICPDCLEEECPSFDEEENEEETVDAYEELKSEYIGKKTAEDSASVIDLNWGEDVSYSMTVTVDDNGYICDISRIKAKVLLWESVTSNGTRPYPVSNEDYETAADEIEDNIEITDEDE